jgi:hypothetical protein
MGCWFCCHSPVDESYDEHENQNLKNQNKNTDCMLFLFFFVVYRSRFYFSIVFFLPNYACCVCF